MFFQDINSAITVDLVRSHFKICSVTLFLSGPGISSGEYNSTSSVSIAGSTNLICNRELIYHAQHLIPSPVARQKANVELT
ncbi:4263_t:CDS:2 [Entrophospora sp. SA101]|nr:4263_t:CDS:2 [Entrophospora sp. SA101]